jgi:opacity protein-like surface antigen
MRRIKSAAALLALAAALLAVPSAAIAASVSPAESVYTHSDIYRCMLVTDGHGEACVVLGTYSTYSATQIWINGHVSCSWYANEPTNLEITWCGVGGGNGTAVLNIGVNWQVPNWDASGLYERMDILAGHGGCSTWGTNSAVGQIYTWANASLQCESAA